LVNDPTKLEKRYKGHSQNILKQLQNLSTAPNPMELPPSSNFHKLKGSKKNLFAIDVNPRGRRGRERILFRPVGEWGTDMRKIEIISIYELCKDYH